MWKSSADRGSCQNFSATSATGRGKHVISDVQSQTGKAGTQNPSLHNAQAEVEESYDFLFEQVKIYDSKHSDMSFMTLNADGKNKKLMNMNDILSLLATVNLNQRSWRMGFIINM